MKSILHVPSASYQPHFISMTLSSALVAFLPLSKVSFPLSRLLFQTVHLFIMTKFDPLGLDYHILSVQQLASKCLAQPDLRDELYCQILRQISGTPKTSAIYTLQVVLFFTLFCTCITYIAHHSGVGGEPCIC